MFLMMVLGNILWIALLGVLVWAVIRWFNRQPGGFGSDRPGAGPSAVESFVSGTHGERLILRPLSRCANVRDQPSSMGGMSGARLG